MGRLKTVDATHVEANSAKPLIGSISHRGVKNTYYIVIAKGWD
ncbi:MAG: hypothetical protein ACE5OP_13975 [Candidatus Glassbacteria bacterium]